MSQEPLLPLLQTVYHAGLITLITLMADPVDDHHQMDKLSHLDHKKITRVSIQLPKMRYDDPLSLDARNTEGRINGDATETKKTQLESPKMRTMISVGDKTLAEHNTIFTDSERGEVSGLVLPSAPIYSFDEDGEILQRVNIITPTTEGEYGYHSRFSDTPYDEAVDHNNDINDPIKLPLTSTPETVLPVGVDLWHRIDQSFVAREDRGVSTSLPSCHPFITSLGDLESLPNIDDTPADSVLLKQVRSLKVDDIGSKVNAQTEISVMCEAEGLTTPDVIPKIDFHAASIEVVDDYLEDNLKENQLGDLCSTLLGDTASWKNSRSKSTQNFVAGLLSAGPQETPCKRQRVPFHTVVFTERKPSTGDALVLSLGLSADGANTIQDIASKNQGAARERLQQGEMLPPETKLTRHCESCGVSPEDCLKKLGLHSDHVGLLSPSPKSERLLHFFRNIQPVPPRPHPCHTPIGSDPHLEKSHQEAPRPQSRSLTTSPTHSEDDSRKPRLNTF